MQATEVVQYLHTSRRLLIDLCDNTSQRYQYGYVYERCETRQCGASVFHISPRAEPLIFSRPRLFTITIYRHRGSLQMG